MKLYCTYIETDKFDEVVYFYEKIFQTKGKFLTKIDGQNLILAINYQYIINYMMKKKLKVKIYRYLMKNILKILIQIEENIKITL